MVANGLPIGLFRHVSFGAEMTSSGGVAVDVRVVVAGPGILAAATAYHLARAKIPVTLVRGGACEAERVSAGFGGLSYLTDETDGQLDLVRRAMREHVALSPRIAGEGWFRFTSALLWRLDGTLAKRVDPLRRQGEAVWQMTRDEALAMTRSALWIPPSVSEIAYASREPLFDVGVCAQALVRRAVELGAEVIAGDAVIGFDMVSSGWVARLASGGSLSGDVVVNAMGPGAGELAPRRIPSVKVRALLVSVATPGFDLFWTVHTDRLSLRPSAPGVVLARSDVADQLVNNGFSVAESEVEVLRRVREVVPRIPGWAATEVKVGSRSVRTSGLPVTGADPELPGYYEPFAQCSVLIGPLLGRLLAEQIAEGAQPAELTPAEG